MQLVEAIFEHQGLGGGGLGVEVEGRKKNVFDREGAGGSAMQRQGERASERGRAFDK